MGTRDDEVEKKLQEHYSTEGIPLELVQSIAFLRQWLNEDRKCTPMVTARDIWHWLGKDFTQALQTAEMRERERILDVLIKEGYLKGKSLIPHDDSKKSHGSCCYCGTCGHDNDYCVCGHNELLEALTPITQ